jgi:mRNA interferase HigB
MRVIALKTLRIYWSKEPNSEQALKSWFAVVKKAQWGSHNDLKEQLGKASIINSKRVVFNIHGNKYRLIVDIEYKVQQIFIVWIGTHAEYDKINVEDVDFERLD